MRREIERIATDGDIFVYVLAQVVIVVHTAGEECGGG